jgi:hypothetical protein
LLFFLSMKAMMPEMILSSLKPLRIWPLVSDPSPAVRRP